MAYEDDYNLSSSYAIFAFRTFAKVLIYRQFFIYNIRKKIEINSFVSYNIIFIRSLISILDKRIPICLPINPVSSAVCVLMTVETPIRGS